MGLTSWSSAAFLLAYALMVQSGVESFDWCSVTCSPPGAALGMLFGGASSGGTPTTMCTFPKGGGPQCAGQTAGLTAEEKKFLLDTHNELRNKVALGKETRGGGQPSAANMMKLEWDDEAEELAQRWAEQCKEGPHDACNAGRDGKSMGQNTAMTFESRVRRMGSQISANTEKFNPDRMRSVKTGVIGFYDEVEKMAASYVDRFSGAHAGVSGDGVIGHYTQFVWGPTSRVGCGMAIHDDGNGLVTSRIVCNYKISGNMLTAPIYTRGKPASQCPEKHSRSLQYPGLCEPSPSFIKWLLTLPVRLFYSITM